MQSAILQDDLPLADDHQWRATALHALEDVVLERLGRESMKTLAYTLPKISQTKERSCPEYQPQQALNLSVFIFLSRIIFPCLSKLLRGKQLNRKTVWKSMRVCKCYTNTKEVIPCMSGSFVFTDLSTHWAKIRRRSLTKI